MRLLKTKATGHVYLGDLAAAERTGTGLVEASHGSDDPAVMVSALVFQSQTSFYRGRLAKALEYAEDATRRAAAVPVALYLRRPRIPALWLATVLTATDRLADAPQVLREGQREAEALGLGWSLPHWHAARACALLEQGALDDAAVEAEAGLAVADELEITLSSPQARAVLALVELRRGDIAKAKDHLAVAPTGVGAHTQRYGPWVSLARACPADAEGEAGAAAVALAECFGTGEPARLLVLTPSHWPTVVRTALLGEHPALAEAVCGALLDLTAEDGSRHITGAVRAHVDGLLHRDAGALEPTPRTTVSAAPCRCGTRAGPRPITLHSRRPSTRTRSPRRRERGHHEVAAVRRLVRHQLYDGLLRQRETQTPALGTTNRLVAETLYDTRGFAWKSYAAYYADGTPSKTLVKGADNQVPAATENVYDGMGRVTDTIARTYGDEKWRTKTVYEGDRTTVIPPKGGTATQVVTDACGRTTNRLEYTNAARTASQETTYGYGKWDEPIRVTDPAGNTWNYAFDARGQQTRPHPGPVPAQGLALLPARAGMVPHRAAHDLLDSPAPRACGDGPISSSTHRSF